MLHCWKETNMDYGHCPEELVNESSAYSAQLLLSIDLDVIHRQRHASIHVLLIVLLMTKQCELRRRSKWRGLSYEQCTWELLEDLNAFNAEDTRRSVMKYS
eukprot:78068_1